MEVYMHWLVWVILGLIVIYFVIRYVNKQDDEIKKLIISPEAKDTTQKPDIADSQIETTYGDQTGCSCGTCQDGAAGHYSEQICSECGRQLDPFMNC